MKLINSKKIIKLSEKIIPGGVNSPVRAFKSVGGIPPVIKSAKGSKIYDIDGNEYIDYVGSWGPMILGHSNSNVNKVISDVIKKGTSFGAPTLNELKFAELIVKMVPSVEMVRLVNSGTEAAMSAIRLARGVTGKNKIIKFEGCYHGHYDGFLIKAGSGSLTYGIPGTPGIPEKIAALTCLAEFNSIDSVKNIIQTNKNEIAAVIIEPVPGNMGCVKPENNFLNNLASLCRNEKIFLIFDEVITGFRLSEGGAQKLYNIKPDITILAKISGGGLPLGAYGGSKKIMQNISPSGNIYQAGTLSGNPVAVAAGLKTLQLLNNKQDIYTQLEKKSLYFETEIKKIIIKNNYPLYFNRCGSMWTLYFTSEKVKNYETALKCDTKLFSKYFHRMLLNGIYLPPSQFETCFISITHTNKDIDKTVHTIKKVLKTILT